VALLAASSVTASYPDDAWLTGTDSESFLATVRPISR